MNWAEEKARFKQMVPLWVIQVTRLGSWTWRQEEERPPAGLVLSGAFWNEPQFTDLRGSFAKVVVAPEILQRGAGQLMEVVCPRPVEEAPCRTLLYKAGSQVAEEALKARVALVLVEPSASGTGFNFHQSQYILVGNCVRHRISL